MVERIVAARGLDVARIVARLRGCAGADMVMLLIEAEVAPLDRAMLIAAAGELAVELAPGTRIAVIEIAPGANPADIAAAADFLESARSTTGQVLKVAAER